METLVDATTLSTMGLVETRERLGTIWRAYRTMRRIVRNEKPDLVILIDFAEFNMALAGVAHRAGVPVLYYISPQVWAWRRRRVQKIARRVSRLAVVFPFEVPLYAGTGVRADFVGHPLLDQVRVTRDRAATFAAHGLDPAKRLVALLPGSRSKEMQLLLPPMAEAAARLAARGDCQCTLALADTLSDADIAVSMRGAALPFPVVRGDTYNLVHASDAVIVASGTATLETALLERPMVIAYRTAPLTYALARRLVSVPFIGMPNLIAGRAIVPELAAGGRDRRSHVHRGRPLPRRPRLRSGDVDGARGAALDSSAGAAPPNGPPRSPRRCSRERAVRVRDDRCPRPRLRCDVSPPAALSAALRLAVVRERDAHDAPLQRDDRPPAAAGRARLRRHLRRPQVERAPLSAGGDRAHFPVSRGHELRAELPDGAGRRNASSATCATR